MPIERLLLAQAATDGTRDAIETAKRRDLEMTSGQVEGLTHDAVMKAARRAIGCAMFIPSSKVSI